MPSCRIYRVYSSSVTQQAISCASLSVHHAYLGAATATAHARFPFFAHLVHFLFDDLVIFILGDHLAALWLLKIGRVERLEFNGICRDERTLIGRDLQNEPRQLPKAIGTDSYRDCGAKPCRDFVTAFWQTNPAICLASPMIFHCSFLGSSLIRNSFSKNSRLSVNFDFLRSQ
jgi:hypothetical protein